MQNYNDFQDFIQKEKMPGFIFPTMSAMSAKF